MSLQFRYLVLLCLFSLNLHAQKTSQLNFWKNISETSLDLQKAERQIIPNQYQTFELDLKGLKKEMEKAPMRFTEKAKTSPVIITLPTPNGNFEQFKLVEAPVMEAGLAAKYPNIKTWAGAGIDDPTAYLRIDVSHKGFRAMIRSARNGTSFIDPFAKNDTKNYIVYYKKHFQKEGVENLTCQVDKSDFIQAIPEEKKSENQKKADKNPKVNAVEKSLGDCQLRTYRLALACTGEYATYHGGTVMDVMAEFVTAMNRVNGVYETDATITMILIDNNDDVIYLDAGTDPYTNNNGGTMLGQNQTTLDNVIGTENYDIGHVFSTGGGGIAGLGVPCGGSKARGVTGLGNPINDPFYIDYVAHEMGHQFGANHTQNNPCNRNGPTAMEPGSASTIMGYAGICNPNVQNNSDDHFHAVSLDEIDNYVINGNGGSCPVITPSGNNAPTVSVENASYVLPISTPFFLTADGDDADADDVLTYCWEQMDNQVANMPPEPTNTGGPAFRSNSPVESPTRYFPNLNAINNNQTPTWEVLPSVSREMNFRCTVRDNFLGAGCQAEVDVDLEFDGNSGPFLVTNPNDNQTWLVGENQTITWDVANTDMAPVSCDLVDILLSLDGGQTYTIVLASQVPNDGTHDIQVPNNLTNTARVKVLCSSSIFFDISNENFVIEEPPAPTFLLDVDPIAFEACQEDEVTYNIDLSVLLGFNEEITLSLEGLPTGAMSSFTNNPVAPPGISSLTINNLGEVSGGTYTMNIQATSATVDRTVEISLTVYEDITDVAVLTSPTDGEEGISDNPILTWDAVPHAGSYLVEVANNPSFDGGSIVESATVATNSYQTQNVGGSQNVFYWRVQAANICSEGEFSTSSAFQIAPSACMTYSGDDLPLDIPGNQTDTWTTTITIEDDFDITDLNIFLDIEHSWVGDLILSITSPSGTMATLLDQPGVPGSNFGCGNDDLIITFDDDAENTADDLEGTCEGSSPTISGDFQSIDPLSAFNGESSMGVWTLSVTDVFNQDGGSVDIWDLELCQDLEIIALNLINNQILTVPNSGSENISQTYLQVEDNNPSAVIYTLLSLPANGDLYLGMDMLSIGDTFTQEDIDNLNLSYQHDASDTTDDSFNFDVLNSDNGWLHNGVFQIQILQNTLSANAELSNDISCNNANDATITVDANGGTAPLSYSIDGMNFQAENTFNNLSEGNYTITVADINNFTITTNSIQVTNPTLLTIGTDVAEDVITVNASGGTGDLSYSIDGNNFQSSNVFSDLENGTYTVTVMDENGCTAETTVIIAVNTLLASATIVNEITCNGANDASVEVIIGGGTPPYQYSINGVDFGSEAIFSDLSPGEYTFTVMDNEGFSATTDAITINQPAAISANATSSGYDITVNASGGTGNLSYSIDGINFQSGNVFEGNTNGSYTVTVMDENGCTVITNVSVDVEILSGSSNIDSEISCYDESDGSISVNASGGVPPYQYSIDGNDFQDESSFSNLSSGTYTVVIMDSGGFTFEVSGIELVNPSDIEGSVSGNGYDIEVSANGGTGTLSYSLDGMNFQDSPVFENPGNGDYTITVIDENGCSITLDYEVNIPTLASEAGLEVDISCNNANDGIIFAQAEGGIPPYQYSIDGMNFQDSPAFNNLSEGVYTITIIDAGGMTIQTNEVTVNNPEAISGSASAFGQTITVTASGGTGTLTYSANGNDFQSSNILEVDQNGEYTVYVQDQNGCLFMIDVTVNAITGVIVEVGQILCGGLSNGAIEITEVVGGYGPYLYSFNGDPFGEQSSWEDLAPGTYTIVVQDSEGYEFELEEIVINDIPILELETQLDENNITLNVAGGTAPYIYSIDGGATFSDEPVFENLPNGSYNIVVQDANGCAITENIIISSVFDLEDELLFEIAPNPSAGLFQIKILQNTDSQLNARVFDVTGKLVYDQIWTKSSTLLVQTLNLEHLPQGNYQLIINDEKQIGVKRMVIIR